VGWRGGLGYPRRPSSPSRGASISPSPLPPPKTALVTGTCALVSGATGFFGGHLAAALAAAGYRVRALARSTSDVRRLQALGVEIVRGDLDDPASLRRAAEGQRLVFHTAGKVSDWGARADFFRANVDGTANVIAACRQAGVERLVHLSSLTVLGLPRHGELVDEATPYGADVRDHYSASKLAGEKLARAANGEGLAVTVIRPGVIWGPGDTVILPRFAALLRRRAMVITDGGRNLIALSHVANLAAGVRLAAETAAAAGQIYHLTDGEELTARDAIEAIAETIGTPPPRASLPYWLVLGAATAVELGAKLLRSERPPPITRYGVRLISCDCRYDLGKARRELGYAPKVTFREGVRALKDTPALTPVGFAAHGGR
jgi:nucleoside-diphosphate-sugar epimerase